jgi:His/Glu/Gln/Arg/opine family amino acid ABC transporter permease subunit
MLNNAYQFRWDIIPANLDFLMAGLSQTLIICAVTLVLSIFGGLALALMDMSKVRILRYTGLAVGEIIRNTPVLVQLLWAYYVLPIVFGWTLEALPACILALTLYSSAFLSEAYRAGIQAVPPGQKEAAQVLGLSPRQTFLRIVLPQAVRLTLPAIASNFVQLIKYSSLGSVISVSEITRRGMELSATAFRPLEIFTFIAIVYFAICWPLAMAIRIWERRLAAQ